MPRLGEILLAEKLLTTRELETALENHVLHGVKLGTCLVEMAYVKDEDLARCLGKKTGHGFLSKDQLLLFGSQNLSFISPAAIKKQRIIPVGIDGATLRIATDNEISVKKLAELEQFFGRKLEPVMVSGYAVDCFLEKVFGIQRPGRFLPNYAKVKTAHAAPATALRERPQETSLVIDGVEWKNLDEVTKSPEYEQSFSSDSANLPDNDFYPLTLSDLSKRLNHATSREDIARAALEFLSCTSQVAALVIIKDTIAQGWSAISNKKKLAGFKDTQFAISRLPDLYQCISSQRPFIGNTDTSETRLLIEALHHGDLRLAYFPISIQQHVVAVLICDRPEHFNAIEVTELSRKISYALAIIILRSKLLS